MSDGTLGYLNPDSPTGLLDTELLTVSAVQVHRERVRIAGAAAADLAPVDSTFGLAVDIKRAVELVAGGDIAHDAADGTAKPLKIGGHAYSGVPTGVATNDRVDAWFGLKGQQVVSLGDAAGVLLSLVTPADAQASQAGIPAWAQLQGWNGTAWDRLRSTTANGLVVDVSRIQGTVSIAVASYAGWKTTDATVGTSSAQLVSTPLSTRRAIEFHNRGTADIWLTFQSPAVVGTGKQLEAGAVWAAEMSATASIWAISATAGQSLGITEFN